MVIDCKVQYRIDIWLYLVFGDDIFVLYIQIKITVNSTENTIISNKGMRTAAVIAPVHELVDFVTTNCWVDPFVVQLLLAVVWVAVTVTTDAKRVIVVVVVVVVVIAVVVIDAWAVDDGIIDEDITGQEEVNISSANNFRNVYNHD